jgi:2-dehydro-3-deoxyphosphooctonate aldolase (KDO 8-P synthase)
MEVHDSPKDALSDANTVLDIKYLENILAQAKIMHETRLEILDKFGGHYLLQIYLIFPI